MQYKTEEQGKVTIQQLSQIQILLPFPILKLLPFYIPMLQTSNLAVLLIFFLLFSFLVLTKCQVLNLRMGKSRDQVLQRAYSRPLEFKVYWVAAPVPPFPLPLSRFLSRPVLRAPHASTLATRSMEGKGDCWQSTLHWNAENIQEKGTRVVKHERHHNSQSECVSRLIDSNQYQGTISTLMTISTFICFNSCSVRDVGAHLGTRQPHGH